MPSLVMTSLQIIAPPLNVMQFLHISNGFDEQPFNRVSEGNKETSKSFLPIDCTRIGLEHCIILVRYATPTFLNT